MNLYLFSSHDGAVTYGVRTYLKELTNALEGADIKICIVYLHTARLEFSIEKIQEVEHLYIPEACNQSTFSGSVQKLEDYCRNVAYFLRLHIKDTKDLVFHFNFNHYQFLAKELKKYFDCKTVATVHYLKWIFEFEGNLHKIRELKSKPANQRKSFEEVCFTTDEYENLLYKEVDRVIALSQDMKNYLCTENRIDPNKIIVIPNGLSDTNRVEKTGKHELRKKWRIAPKELLILFAGRLHKVKGLLFLIRAFHKVLAKKPNCRLIIAGSGQFKAYLQEAKDVCTKVTFTGLLERK